MKTSVVKTGENSFNITLEDLTKGKILAIMKALSDYSEKSMVCTDVLVSVNNALKKENFYMK